MSDNENGFSLKEILKETRVNVDNHRNEFLELRDKYEKQSTNTKDKVEKAEIDINGLGKQGRSLEKRVSRLELRVYTAVTVITILGFVIQTFWNK